MGCSNLPLWSCNTPPLSPERESAHNSKRSESGESAESIGHQRSESRGDEAKVAGRGCLYSQLCIWQKKQKGQRKDGAKWCTRRILKVIIYYIFTGFLVR